MQASKLDWMTAEAKSDGMNLSEDEIVLILAYAGHVEGPFTDAEQDYVMELEREWHNQD